MKLNKIVDNTFLQVYIGNAFLKKIKNSGQTISAIAEKLGYSQPYLSRVLNGKDTTLKKEKIEEIAIAIGFSKSELENIIKNAKKEEFKAQFKENITSEDKNSVDEKIKVVLSRDYGIDDEKALEDIENFIHYVKLKYGESPKL